MAEGPSTYTMDLDSYGESNHLKLSGAMGNLVFR